MNPTEGILVFMGLILVGMLIITGPSLWRKSKKK